MCGNIDPEEEGFQPIQNVRSAVRKKPRKDTRAVCHKLAKKINSHLDKERLLREKKIDDTKICNTAGNVTA